MRDCYRDHCYFSGILFINSVMKNMLDYKLCEELKDVGFLQGGKGFFLTSIVYEPTLSELISACEDGFRNLYYYNATKRYACNVEVCCLDCSPEGWDTNESIAKAPEEAVAHLWLKLNNPR